MASIQTKYNIFTTSCQYSNHFTIISKKSECNLKCCCYGTRNGQYAWYAEIACALFGTDAGHTLKYRNATSNVYMKAVLRFFWELTTMRCIRRHGHSGN